MTPPVNTNHNDRDLIEESTDYFVTLTSIKHSVSIDWLVSILRKRATNGQLCLQFKDGGIRHIELQERTKTTGKKADDIRKILDMD